MGIDAVRRSLERFGAADRIREFEDSSATVEQAAQVLRCKPERIAKTLAFDVKGAAVLIVAAGDAKIDNRKFKDRFGVKAKMLAPEETLARIGHAVGGVCPFAVPDGVEICLDASLKRFPTVFPACGSRNSAIETTLEELELFSGSSAWVDVCKEWNGEAGS